MTVQKTKIMHVVLEMDLGGLQRIVNLLIKKSNKEQFIPYLCCLDRGGLFYEQISSDSIKKYVLGRKPVPFDFRMFVKLVKIIKENRIDIIHSHNGCSMYAALAGRMCGVKGVIHTDHGRLVPDRPTAILEDRLASYLMDRFIGVSEGLTEYLASTVKIRRKSLATIINGVDSNKFTPLNSKEKYARRLELGFDPDAMIIGTICRLDPIKNLNTLIDSVPSISRNIPNCQIVIVGDGLEEKRLRERVRRLNIDTKVVFSGRVADVERLLPVFDLYVNTSISEGTSVTILEAMSCGLPIVASSVGGNVKLINNSNGVLFPFDRADLFQESIISLLNNPKALESMGRQSRDSVKQRFSFDQVVEHYTKLYLALVNK